MGNASDKKGRGVKIAAVVSAVVLLTLLFLSKTIYNYNLPKVTAVETNTGKLHKVEVTKGIAAFYDSAELYADLSGKLDQILVREGETVKKGDPIFVMSFGNEKEEINKQLAALDDELTKNLDSLRISNDKINIDIERINASIKNVERKITDLIQENYTSGDISDYEITQCEMDIKDAEASLNNLRMLFDGGVVPKSDIENAERSLQILRTKYENLQQQNIDAVQDQETNRIKQLNEYEYQLASYTNDLASKKMDLIANAVQEDTHKKEYNARLSDYKEMLSDYEKNAVIYAPLDAVVSTIHIKTGQYVNAKQQLASFGLMSGYVVECEISLNNNFVMAGDTANLSNSSHVITGTVIKIVPAKDAKAVTLLIDEAGVTAGETFEVLFEKQSAASYTLVPNNTINKDASGYFVNQIARRNGILGKEYYTKKRRIIIGDSDYDNTAVVQGIGLYEAVASLSDKPFSEGDTIELLNERDFFEN